MKLSILLPIKNFNIDLLDRCINSILNQSYSNFEIILKCDCSDIEFKLLKNNFNDERIIYLNSSDNSVTEAGNQALSLSSGDIITLFAHDDYYQPNAFDVLIKNIDESKWYFGSINYYSNDVLCDGGYKDNPTIDGMMSKNLIPQPACFWKREVYDEIGDFDETFNLCWDYDYWIRIMKKYSPKYIDYKFSNYYLNPNSISIKYSELMNQEKDMILKKHFTL